MRLRYATVTGVARDDLPDEGAWLFTARGQGGRRCPGAHARTSAPRPGSRNRIPWRAETHQELILTLLRRKSHTEGTTARA